MELVYYAMKVVLFASVLRALVTAESLQRYTLWLAGFYTAAVAFLSYTFLVGPQSHPNWELWQYWLGLNFLLSAFYFRLIARFDEGRLFWLILPMGALVVLNEPNLIPIWLRLVRGG